MPAIRLIIFDWDGTLMDSEAAIVEAMTSAYRDVDVTPPPYGAIRDIIGLSLDDSVSRLSPGLATQDRAGIVTGYRRHYGMLADTPVLFPGVLDTLEALHDAGFYLAVATGKSRAGLARAIAQTGLAHLFLSTRTADESEPKPSPAMLHEILDELDVEPDGALMLGDTEYDLTMARAAGTHAGAVAYGAHAPDRLRRHGPAFLIDEFSHLPARIAALPGTAK